MRRTPEDARGSTGAGRRASSGARATPRGRRQTSQPGARLWIIALELAGLNVACAVLIYYLRRADLNSTARGERRIELAEKQEQIDLVLEEEVRRARKAVETNGAEVR